MRLWLAAAATAVLAASCAPPMYREPDPDPIVVPDPPPKTVMRQPVEFRFKDYETGKEYSFRRFSAPDGSNVVRPDRLGGEKSSISTVHEDGDVRLEVITVLDAPGGDERLATPEERAYALGVLQKDWVERGRDEMMTYHSDAAARERRVRADLLDDDIYYRSKVLEDLKQERFELQADLDASTQTPGYQAPESRLNFLRGAIEMRDANIGAQEATLALLRDLKRRRDSEMGRSSAPLRVHEWMPVRDLVDRAKISPERLVSEVRSNVRPGSWSKHDAVLRYSGGHLEVANTRAAIDETRDYLQALRARVLNGER